MKGHKVLLVKPDYRYFPIGMSYVVKAFEDTNIEYHFVDMHLNPEFNLREAVRSGEYYAVASAGLIGSFTFFRKFFATVKEEAPWMPTLLAGNITWDFPTRMLFETIACDYIVVGEGEITGVELLRHIKEHGIAPTETLGVAFRDPVALEGFTKTARRPPLDLTAKAWLPTWDFFDIKAYGFQGMPVLTGRGCPGRCSFCSPTNGRFRSRPMDHVFEEIDMLNEKFDFLQFHFMNEVFYPDPESIIEFCERYKKVRPHKAWHCLMRMDTDPMVLRHMRDAGCEVMNVGVESGSDRVLELIKKDLTVSQTRTFVQNLKATELVGQASFMMANYGECEEDIKATIDLLLELKVSGPMALTINYPGTLNYKRARRRGLISDELSYVESLDSLYGKNYFQVISGHLSGRLRYLNLSGMSDNALFHVVEREMRRYFTEGFRIQDVCMCVRDGKHYLEGKCPFCDHTLSHLIEPPFISTYDMVSFCNKCGASDTYFSPFDLPGNKAHYEAVRQRLRSAERILVVASENQARRFLMYDHFGLDYGKLLGFAAFPDLECGFALTHPVRLFDELLAQNPDCIFVLRSNVLLAFLFAKHPELFADRSENSPVVFAERLEERQKLAITRCDAVQGERTLLVSSSPVHIFQSLWDVMRQNVHNTTCDVLVQQHRMGEFSLLPDRRTITFSGGNLHVGGVSSESYRFLVEQEYTNLIFSAASDNLTSFSNIFDFAKKIDVKHVYVYEKSNLGIPDSEKILLRIEGAVNTYNVAGGA